MRCYQFRRRVGEPFGQREILVIAALEHLQKFQVGAAGVLDVVWQCFLDVADVTHFEVHCSGAGARSEDGHAAFAADVELPFVGVGVPVQLAHASGFYRDDGRGDGGGDFEATGIDDAHFAALQFGWRGMLCGAKRKIDG